MIGPLQALLKQAPSQYRKPAPRPETDVRDTRVVAGDALNITFVWGNTLSQTAKSYTDEPTGGGSPAKAQQDTLNRLLQQNGGTDKIYAGKSFQLKTTSDASFRLNAAIAVQKSIASRLREGQFFPAFDYNRAQIRRSSHDSWEVTLPSRVGTHAFHVLDNAQGNDTSLYTVFTKAEWNAINQ